VALDQYTKRQKFFLVAITILGAALFTVTGAMLAVSQSCGEEGAMTGNYAGNLDGQDVDRIQFQLVRRVIDLSLSRYLDGPYVPVFPDENASTRLIHNKMPAGTQSYPLFAMWPRYHDQDIWLFLATAKRAEDKGFTRPPLEEARDWYFLTNPNFKALVRENEAKEHFAAIGVRDVNRFLTAVSQLMMINDYVSTLVQEVQPDKDELLELLDLRNVERNAVVFGVSAESMLDEAEAELDRQIKQREAALISSRIGGSGRGTTHPSMYDQMTHSLTEAEQEVLDSNTRVVFDVVYGDIESMMRSIIGDSAGSTELEQFYQNMRGTSFVASAKQIENFDKRLESVMPRWESAVKPRFGDDEAKWNAWLETRKQEMKVFLDYYEVEADVQRLFARFRATQAARYGVEAFKEKLDERKEELREAFDDERMALEAKFSIPAKSYDTLRGLRGSIENFRAQSVDKLKSLTIRKYATGRQAAREVLLQISNQQSFNRDNLNGRLENIDQALMLDNFEREVIQQQASLDDAKKRLSDLQEEGNSAAEGLTAKELQEKLDEAKFDVERLGYDLEASEKVLELAKELRPQLDTMIEQMTAFIADALVKFDAMSTSEVSVDLVFDQITQLAYFDLPRALKKAQAPLKLEERLKTLREQTAWNTAQIDMRQAAFERRSDDLSSVDFQVMLDTPEFQRYDLNYSNPFGTESPKTIEELSADSNWYWVANLPGARAFLDDAANKPGKVSTVLERPGYGYYLFRIISTQPGVKSAPATAQASDAMRKLAIKRIARRLAREEMERIRNEANLHPNPMAYLHVLVGEGRLQDMGPTGYFGWNAEVPAINPVPDPDKNASASLSQSNPYSGFFASLAGMGAERVVGGVFVQGTIDAANPAMNNTYTYCVAMETGRRVSGGKILPATERDLLQYGFSGMAPQLAQNEELMTLMNPAKLIANHKVLYYPVDYRDPDSKKKKNEDSE